jgi:hypothetical protein
MFRWRQLRDCFLFTHARQRDRRLQLRAQLPSFALHGFASFSGTFGAAKPQFSPQAPVQFLGSTSGMATMPLFKRPETGRFAGLQQGIRRVGIR